jgi:iron complex transport system permease protein
VSADSLASDLKTNRDSQSLDRRRLIARLTVIGLCALLVAGSMILALGVGAQDIPADQVLQALIDRDSVPKAVGNIIHVVRLPRALVGALVGLNLALSGAMLQGVVRSPLGDPYILGVSAGGALAASYVTLRLGRDFPPDLVPPVAFMGSLIGALIVYAVAWDGTGVTTTRLVLAGGALTAMIGALTTTIVVMSVQGGAQFFFQWLVGGLYTAGWSEYRLLWPYSLGGFVAAMALATRANILALGDDMAQGLGLRVELTRFMMSAVAAVLAGSAVAAAGLVGFVGLLVPFVARRLVGSDYRFLLPVCALLGAALMVMADWSAQEVFPQLLIDPNTNTEFPVGIITAVFGGPLFLWLVRARRATW